MLYGEQEPRFSHVPPAKTSAGQEAVDLAASVGLILDPAQALVLDGGLAERPNGNWAAFEVAVVGPRQNLKTMVARVRQLAGLYLFDERLQTHTAHRADASLEQFRETRDLAIRISDDTGNKRLKLKKIIETHGQESIELMSGQRLNFKNRSKDSGRAFSGDVVYFDEAMRLTDLGALIPTLSARPNPQLWYLSSAPLPKVESDILRRICRRGRRAHRGETREPRFTYFEFCAKEDPGPRPEVDEDDPEFTAWLARWRQALAEANPALGRRITEEFCETERAAMDHEEFIRERLGIFPEILDAVDPVIDPEDWKACVSPKSKPVDPVVFAFEVSPDRKWSYIGTAGISTSGGIHVEQVEKRRHTRWVVDRLLELHDKHKPAAIVCHAGGPAGALLKDLEAKGLDITKATGPEFAQACALALDDITEHRWRHLDQADLNAAVTGAARRDTGDAMVFDRRTNLDISSLVAVSLAAWAVRRPDGSSIYEERGMVTA